MQCCTRSLISKIIHAPIIRQCNYRTNGKQNSGINEEEQNNNLICSKWEEAIIKVQQMPDIPFDLMQKNTIDHIHNKNNYKNKKSNRNSIIKPSN
ncbi:unnamed protein product [Adineta steineri]|uniref:Uncharacterized protein n=1 Tax=Adineta steineri TaxID=433720 RepID=A0A819UMK8_9BILA|nr:unnamed protein product [Adineta steineri]